MLEVTGARDAAVMAALGKLEAAVPGASAVLLTRGGGVLAGKTPSSSGRELFGAMAATMFGAAEAGAFEVGQEVVEVEARLKGGSLVAVGAGRKLVLAVHLDGGSLSDSARAHVHDCARKLSALF